jgi:hypothetical protein
LFIIPNHRCWFINRRWCQLRSQQSAGALAGNQLLPNVTLECDEKALIDLVDGLSSGSVMLVSVTDGDLADHDARLGDGATKRLPGHGDQAQAIATTFLVVVRVLLGGDICLLFVFLFVYFFFLHLFVSLHMHSFSSIASWHFSFELISMSTFFLICNILAFFFFFFTSLSINTLHHLFHLSLLLFHLFLLVHFFAFLLFVQVFSSLVSSIFFAFHSRAHLL